MKNFRVKSKKDLIRDLLSGLIIALVSVPISMGYAQIAGLPAQYGLYGSLFPVLIFGLLTTSPRFVFGIDAAPAALVGSLLTELGITLGSADAISFVPVVTMLTAIWLGLFWLLRGGRFIKYISEPVLGGCVSGIASIVILMQFPKLFGGSAITGRAPELLLHIIDQMKNFHALSFALGASTVVLILISRRRWPRISMSVVLMAIGILLTAVLHIDHYGVALFPATEWEPPSLSLPDFSLINKNIGRVLLSSLTVALVILSETLLSTRSMALEYNDRIDNQREILAYAVGNLAAAICGSSPASGSISRTKRANQFHVSSQWMSISIFVTIGAVLLFFTKYISYLPIPILAGIVIASLASMLEFGLAAELFQLDRTNFFIFLCAFLAEFLGLMEGVLVGVILSFASFTMRSSTQPRYFLGCLEGEQGFFDLSQTPHARPIEHTVLYQFNGALFFANIDDFVNDIENALHEGVRLIVISGITSIDLTATKRLLKLYRGLKQKNIMLFFTGHINKVKEQVIAFGAEELVLDGAMKSRFTEALAAGGIIPPYPLERETRHKSL